MRGDKFAIWITVENENPDLEDIAKAQSELQNLNIPYEGKIGIAFTRIQWGNLLHNLSRFEQRFVDHTPVSIMGFPVRMLQT